MTRSQPHAFLRVIALSTVPDRRPEYEVQVGVFLSVQPPDEEELIPAALSLLAASDWLRGVPPRRASRSADSSAVRKSIAEACARERAARVPMNPNVNYTSLAGVDDGRMARQTFIVIRTGLSLRKVFF